ncbi:MAG TPA: YpmS family protein [Bacillales bacterium]|nr:YpmS family protein [Bacillales bacterium]
MRKVWKSAFFALLAIFIALIVALFALYKHYLPPAEKTDFSIDTKVDPGAPIFTVSTTKQQLQPLINRKIQKYNKMDQIQYRLLFTKKDMVLDGNIQLLGSPIEFQMKFTPKVLDDGNLVLKEHSIRLGLFNLPVDRVLEYIQKSAQLPDSIRILPKKKEIYLALTKIHIENQFYLRARKMDLKHNQIQFSVYALHSSKSKTQEEKQPSGP